MQGEHVREDAKQLLRVAYGQRPVLGSEGMQIDLAEAMRYRGMTRVGSHLDMLVDYMEVTGWVEREDPMYRDAVTGPLIRRITVRGLQVLLEL
jgi:hypothetical protein